MPTYIYEDENGNEVEMTVRYEERDSIKGLTRIFTAPAIVGMKPLGYTTDKVMQDYQSCADRGQRSKYTPNQVKKIYERYEDAEASRAKRNGN